MPLFLQWHHNNNPIQKHDPSYKSFCSRNSGNSKLLFTLLALAQLSLSLLQSGHNTLSSWVCWMKRMKGKSDPGSWAHNPPSWPSNSWKRMCVQVSKEQGKVIVPFLPASGMQLGVTRLCLTTFFSVQIINIHPQRNCNPLPQPFSFVFLLL